MGSSYDDGLKNADVGDGIDGALTRFSPSFGALDEYRADRPVRGRRGASSHTLIERTVEASVITALLRRHGTLHPPAPVPAVPAFPSPAEMQCFCAFLVAGNAGQALGWLAPLRHPFGMLDDHVAGLLSLAAQQLGKAWEDDVLCFAEVSLGLVTLQRVLHEFAPPPAAVSLSERRMLLVPMPGEVHCFGLRMLGTRFQQAGWACQSESHMSEENLLRRVREQRYDVLGLSAQSTDDEARAPGLIARLREISREPKMLILLGGACFAGRPELALTFGADLAPLPFTELSEALDRLIPATGS